MQKLAELVYYHDLTEVTAEFLNKVRLIFQDEGIILSMDVLRNELLMMFSAHALLHLKA